MRTIKLTIAATETRCGGMSEDCQFSEKNGSKCGAFGGASDTQRRPMGIGQDSEIGRPTVTIEVCPRYGREKHNPGFYLEADTLGPGDAEGPSATKRIAVALLRLAYEVAEKVRLQP